MKYTLNNDNFEVVGKQYLQGVGGYDGTNPTESDDLAKIINENTEANLAKLANTYWLERVILEQPVDPCLRTPVVFYYTADGVSASPSEMIPIEVWRCNRLIHLSEASVYVRMTNTYEVSGTEFAYLPASLVNDNGYFLIWEDKINRYELSIDNSNTQPNIISKSNILTNDEIDLIWSANMSFGDYASAMATSDEIINSIGIGDYDE